MSKGRWSAGLSLLFAAAAAFFIFTGGRAYAAEVICQPEKGEITEDAYVLTLTPEEFFLPVAEESSATLDGQKCGINSVSSASHEAVGVTYDALVDISGSMRYDNIMEKVKEVLRQFSAGMKEGDLFRVTKMGNERSSAGFLTDPSLVNAEIDALESIPNEDTNLYKSLVEELDELKRENTNWKKLLLVLSDGKDDQKTGITKEEADQAVQESWIPVFTVATLRNSHTAENEEDAKILGSFARLSHHGAHFAPELEDGEYADVYGRVMESLDRQFIVSLDFGKVMTRNTELQLALSLSDGETTAEVQELLQTAEVEPLLGLVYEDEPEKPEGEQAEASPESDLPAEAGEAAAEETAPAAEGGLIEELKANPLLMWGIIGAAVLIPVIVVILIIVLVRRRKKQIPEQEEDQRTLQPVENGIPAENAVTLTLTRADTGEAYSVTFGSAAVMGRGLQCDISIPHDGALSERHCTFRVTASAISVADMDSTNGTYLNGLPVGTGQTMSQGDTLLAGSAEYTVSWKQ